MTDFKINQGIYWLKSQTTLSEEELQFILDDINTDTFSDNGKFLAKKEIRDYQAPDEKGNQVQDLLWEWVKNDYSSSLFEANDAPSFMIVDDGDGRLEVSDSRDAVFVLEKDFRGKSVWSHDLYVSRLWSYLATSDLPHQPPLSRLQGQNIFRLKEAYLRSSGVPQLFNFEDASALLENTAIAVAEGEKPEDLKDDFEVLKNWFVQNHQQTAFELRLAILILLEMGHLGGGTYVLEALDSLTPSEWQILFRDPDFSASLPAGLSRIEGAVYPVPQTESADLLFSAARVLQAQDQFKPDEWERMSDLFCKVLERHRTNPDQVFPGELRVALLGLKNLLGRQDAKISPDIVSRLYHFIASFQTIRIENMELPTVPSGYSKTVFDQERWVKAKVMDVNLEILTDAFIALDLAGYQGNELAIQVRQMTDQDQDPRDPQDVLTALFMILHTSLPDVPRTEAYVQFYKRVLARKILAQRRGDKKLTDQLEQLQVMNQIGRELERMFWGNSSFRESMLAGHEEELSRRFKSNLDSRDHVLARNLLPLALIKYLYHNYVDSKSEGDDDYRAAWADIASRMEEGEIDLGFILYHHLENPAYEDSEDDGFSRFVKAGAGMSAFDKIVRWSEGREDELPMSVFWQMLNDTELSDYIINGKEARSQALSAIFILRSWSSGVNGRLENYFDYLEGNSNPDTFTITERIAFLEGFRHSDLRHVVPHYLFRFFDDPNELVREKAFEIYGELGYPSSGTRNFLGIHFGFPPETRRTPARFMKALDSLTLETENEGEIGLSPLRESTKSIIGEIVGYSSDKNATRFFLKRRAPFEKAKTAPPVHLHEHGLRLPMSEACFEKKNEKLLSPDENKPFAYRRLAHRLSDTQDPRVIPLLIDAFLMEAPVKVGMRPLYPLMPALDSLLAIFGLGRRRTVEEGLVGTISHAQSTGLLAEALPSLLLQWGKNNRVDVIYAFRKAIYEYDPGRNLEIEEAYFQLRQEREKNTESQNPDEIARIEEKLIELYGEELRRHSEQNPEALDQLIASLYNEVRRQYLIEELARFHTEALQEITERVSILSRKIDDPSVSPTDREKFGIQRERLMEVLAVI